MGIDTFSERHGTGVSHNLLDHGLVYMGLCQHGYAGVPGTVRRLVISKLLHQGREVTVVVVPVIKVRGERGSSEEHLTVTQFKVEREQERLEQLTAQTQQKEQQAASLEKKIEKIQKQQIAVQEVEQIEPHTVPFSSKVMLDRSEYENLAAAAKKFYVQDRKESKLQKALEAALKMVNELKTKVTALTAELAEYKSVRGQLNTAGLEQQNELLMNKLHRYETVIERNGLWNLFRPSRKTKDITRQEEHR